MLFLLFLYRQSSFNPEGCTRGGGGLPIARLQSPHYMEI